MDFSLFAKPSENFVCDSMWVHERFVPYREYCICHSHHRQRHWHNDQSVKSPSKSKYMFHSWRPLIRKHISKQQVKELQKAFTHLNRQVCCLTPSSVIFNHLILNTTWNTKRSQTSMIFLHSAPPDLWQNKQRAIYYEVVRVHVPTEVTSNRFSEGLKPTSYDNSMAMEMCRWSLAERNTSTPLNGAHISPG